MWYPANWVQIMNNLRRDLQLSTVTGTAGTPDTRVHNHPAARFLLISRWRGGFLLLLLDSQLISDVILVDIADISDRFLPDILGHFQFDIAEPLIRIQPVILRLVAKPHNAVRTGVIGGKSKQGFIQWIDARIIKVRVCNVAHHLDAGVDIAVGIIHIRNINRVRRRQLRNHLHHAYRADVALLILIEQRFLVALRRHHQIVEVIFIRVLLEVLDVGVKLLQLFL
jgi:hypothetical protein